MIFLIISFLLSTIFICGMEKTPAIPSAEVLYLQVTKLLARKDLETTLGNYQIILNLLYAHAEWVKIFKKITSIVEDIETVQDYYAKKDKNGVFYYTTQFTFDFNKPSGYLPMKTAIFKNIFINKISESFDDPYKISYNIITPQGIATGLAIGQGITKHPPKALEYYLEKANKFLSNTTNNDEVMTIAGVTKTIVLANIYANNIEQSPCVKDVLQEKELFVYNLISPSLPYINAIYEMTDLLKLFWDQEYAEHADTGHFFVSKKLKDLNNKIKQILKNFVSFENTYQELYKKLYDDLNLRINRQKKNRRTLMHFKKILSEDFFELEETVPIDLPKTITYSILTPFSQIVSPETKIVQKKVSQKKQRKRKKRKKKNQPQQIQKPITPEAQETSALIQTPEDVSLQEEIPLPTNTEQNLQPITHLQLTHSYDDRVLQWLDPNYQELHPLGVLYHTAPLILEKYIFANNIMSNYKNASHPRQVDTSYQSAGEIIYADGKRETVVFTLTFDPANVCYHVGTDHFSGDEIFAEYSAFHYWKIKPPSPENAPAKIEKPTPQQRGSISYIIEKEDEFHVRIRDLTNNVTLILYKKLSF